MPLVSPLLAFAIVRLCFAQFYFENHQSVLGSRGPASSSAHTKTAITAIDAEHALHDGRADADGAADLHLAPTPLIDRFWPDSLPDRVITSAASRLQRRSRPRRLPSRPSS